MPEIITSRFIRKGLLVWRATKYWDSAGGGFDFELTLQKETVRKSSSKAAWDRFSDVSVGHQTSTVTLQDFSIITAP